MNKSLVSYSLIFLIIIPIFGFNFLISFIGNILLLTFLVPVLIFLIGFISFNSLKSKVKTCKQCGAVSLGTNNICANCGTNLGDLNINNFDGLNKPSETIVEINAEEIK